MTLDQKLESIDSLFTMNKHNINGPADFKALIEQFNFDINDVESHLLYPSDLPYGRKCAFRSDNFEVIVMNWKPEQSSNIHNHGASFGCVYSVSGKANNVLYNDNLEQIDSIELINNTIAEVPKGIFHVIENPHDDYAVSVHFYSPPMCGMKVIDANDKTKSYYVKNECGAWDPQLEEMM